MLFVLPTFGFVQDYKISIKRGDKTKTEEWKSEFMKTDLPNK